jgi:2-amino-4-hydroxy-6-hydroxymethyldihydropteridine diphosphokinase
MKQIHISLGSNIGDREKNLTVAIEALVARGIQITRRSSIYSTEPVDFGEQGWFLNCVVEAETEFMPRQLLHVLQEIERSMGRRRLVRRGPRVIDLDILLFGSSVIHSPELEVPHPRMAERRFVLVPLAEIAPEARHPIANKTIRELLGETKDQSAVQLRRMDWKRKKENRRDRVSEV